MKRNITNICIAVFTSLLLGSSAITASAQEETRGPLGIDVSYFSYNNTLPYLTVYAKSKINGRFRPVEGIVVKLYLDKDSTGKGIGLIGTVVTDEKGNAHSDIPPSLAQIWKSTPDHTFIAVSDKNKDYEATSSEITIGPSQISIDTASGKNVVATLTQLKDGKWIPVKGVDMKLAIKRLGGDLLIDPDNETYTTDSLGKVEGKFTRIGLPGDKHGNLVFVAKVEDNDQLGNLRVEKTLPWGAHFIATTDFGKRALWASQFHSPVWLLFICYLTIILVWGTLIYLVFSLIKIKKLGRKEQHALAA